MKIRPWIIIVFEPPSWCFSVWVEKGGGGKGRGWHMKSLRFSCQAFHGRIIVRTFSAVRGEADADWKQVWGRKEWQAWTTSATAAFTHKLDHLRQNVWNNMKQHLYQKVIHIYLFVNFTIFLSKEIGNSPDYYQVTRGNCETGSGIVFLCPMQQFSAALL